MRILIYRCTRCVPPAAGLRHSVCQVAAPGPSLSSCWHQDTQAPKVTAPLLSGLSHPLTITQLARISQIPRADCLCSHTQKSTDTLTAGAGPERSTHHLAPRPLCLFLTSSSLILNSSHTLTHTPTLTPLASTTDQWSDPSCYTPTLVHTTCTRKELETA